MTRKGIVSSISGSKARITFPDIDDPVTHELPVCPHVTDLQVGNAVVVAFWGVSLADGAVVGKVV
jgi:hypothetical protein